MGSVIETGQASDRKAIKDTPSKPGTMAMAILPFPIQAIQAIRAQAIPIPLSLQAIGLIPTTQTNKLNPAITASLFPFVQMFQSRRGAELQSGWAKECTTWCNMYMCVEYVYIYIY